MEEHIVTKIRQQITRVIDVIDYEKPVINEAITDVFYSIIGGKPLPGKGHFTDSQFATIVEVVEMYIAELNRTEVKSYMAEATRLKIALNRLGLLTSVNNAVYASDLELQIWWNGAANFDMFDVRVKGMANALQISEEDLFAIWNLANSIK